MTRDLLEAISLDGVLATLCWCTAVAVVASRLLRRRPAPGCHPAPTAASPGTTADVVLGASFEKALSRVRALRAPAANQK